MGINFVVNESMDSCFMNHLDTSSGLILDAGCGLGGTALHIATRIAMDNGKASVIGIDNDEADTITAKQRAQQMGLGAYVDFRVDNLSTMESFTDRSIDQVFMRNTLCWFVSDPNALGGMLLTLSVKARVGARFSVCEQSPVPNDVVGVWGRVWCLQRELRKLQKRQYLDEAEPDSLASILAGYGHDCIEIHRFPGETIDADVTRNFMRRLDGQCSDTPGSSGIRQELSALSGVLGNNRYDQMPPGYVIHSSLG